MEGGRSSHLLFINKKWRSSDSELRMMGTSGSKYATSFFLATATLFITIIIIIFLLQRVWLIDDKGGEKKEPVA